MWSFRTQQCPPPPSTDFPRKSKNEEKKENRLLKYVLGRGGKNGVEHFRNDKGGKEQDRHFFLPPPSSSAVNQPIPTVPTAVAVVVRWHEGWVG